MSKTAYERDGILSPEERETSAKKCLSILEDAGPEDLRMADYEFLQGQREGSKRFGYQVSERQLAWLRDCVEKFLK